MGHQPGVARIRSSALDRKDVFFFSNRRASGTQSLAGSGKDFRIGPPIISHFATLEWQKTMLEAKRRLNFDAEMQ